MRDGQIRDSYRDALPKPPKITPGNLFFGLAGAASLGGFVVALLTPEQDLKDIFFTIYLLGLSTSCLVYAVIQAHNRSRKYAQAVYFIHYVNHSIRDHVGAVLLGGEEDRDFGHLLEEILTAIASCFSIITGRNCRCCLKELTEHQEIKTVARDLLSAQQAESRKVDSNEQKHLLDDNTDFRKLWYAESGCLRAFLSNDLRRDFMKGEYQNSSFDVLGRPSIFRFFAFSFVTNWRLPYRSALVLPVRWVSEFEPPSRQIGIASRQEGWRVWGFLCVDCNSRNAFDRRHSVDLGGVFADTLYVALMQRDIAEARHASGKISPEA